MMIQEVFDNPELLSRLNSAETEEEIERILSDTGTDIDGIMSELVEDSMENVAGGYIATTPFTRWLADKLKGKGSTIHTSSSGSSHGSTGGRSF